VINLPINTSTKHLIKDTSVYGIGAFITQLIPVLLLPILTRYLSPQEYGIIAIFIVSTTIAVNFIGLNLSAAIQRLYVDYPRDELSKYIGTAIIIICVVSILFLGISFGSKSIISLLTTIPPSWIPAIIILAFFQVIISIIQVIWRMERRPKHFVSFQLLMTITNLSLSILFVIWFLWHWQGRLLGIIISTALCGTLGLFILYRKGFLNFHFNIDHAKAMLIFSLPLIPHTLSTWIMNGSDRLFIVNMVGAGAVGLYSVGYALGQIIQLLQHAFSQAWVPYLFEELKKDQEAIKIRVVKFIYFHHIAIIILALFLHFAAPYILSILVGKNFQGSSKFVFWVAAAYAVNGMYRMVIPFLNYAHKTHLAPIGSTIAAIINLLLNYILIKINGPIGAAQATFISFLILYIITFYFCYKAYKMPWLFWLPQNAVKKKS